MNLPFILDIGIGLLFIYLTLSLLASEFQELLTTVLQWRAKHLREAIEILLSGDSKPPIDQTAAENQTILAQIDQSKELANSLYNHPLLKSLNQEAKGLIGKVGQIVSQATGLVKVFQGQTSGPSYVPSTTFSAALITTLRLDVLVQKLSEIKLYQFARTKLLSSIEDMVEDLRNSKGNNRLLQRELQNLATDLDDISQDFASQQLSLASSFERGEACIRRFISAVGVALPENDQLCQKFLKRLSILEQDLPALIKDAGPQITEAIAELKNLSWVANQIQPGTDPRIILARITDESQRLRFQQAYPLLQALNQSLQAAGETQLSYQQILAMTPPHVLSSLETLAKQIQDRAIIDIRQGMLALEQEIAGWYDRAMDRTAGVYRRNAKGVALIIGFLLAVATNTDTLHIMKQLAKEPTLRQTYAQAASQIVQKNPEAIACFQAAPDPATQAKCLQSGGINASASDLSKAIDQATDIPLGWSRSNWQDQWQPSRRGLIASIFFLLVGWLTSGIAISMGAPFWFNLVQRVVNVRNTGDRPKSVSD